MSIWADIYDRSTGEDKRREDIRYVIPTSNFFRFGAWIYGIPCKLLDKLEGDTIRVKSCVTGINYTIPDNWYNEYPTLEMANKNTPFKGVEKPDFNKLIGHDYWVPDNSWIMKLKEDEFDDSPVDVLNHHYNLYRHRCTIASAPYKKDVEMFNLFDSSLEYETKTFINVRYEGDLYRVLFEEPAIFASGCAFFCK